MRVKLLAIAVATGLTSGCAQYTQVAKSQPAESPVEPERPPVVVERDMAAPLEPSQSEIAAADSDITPDTPEPQAITLLGRIRDGMELVGQHSHPRLDKQVSWYASHPAYFERVLGRAQRYLYHIVSEVESRGMPLELALLPAVESAYDPFAYSHSHAAGLWQFIPGTAKRFGLKRDWWYDGRRDVIESTRAALEYLEYLHKLFDGDWLLALAAYNSGEGTVRRAVARNKKAGKDTDFWSLKLPRETRAYVPQLLALSQIIAEPDNYNLTLAEIDNRPYFGEVSFGAQMDLEQAAAMAAIDSEELYRLNPAYNRWTTSPGDSHKLLLPVDAVERFQLALATTPKEQWIASREYRVANGDYLGKIARQHKVSVADLRRENNLHSDLLSIGQVLRIPGAGASPINRKRSYYTVVSGDSLWKIARANNVSIKNLRAWNNLAPKEMLQPGQQLQVSSSKPVLKTTNRKLRYKVKRGDSLARIASHFNVRVKDIVSWNKINPTKYLQPGQRLTLFVDIRGI